MKPDRRLPDSAALLRQAEAEPAKQAVGPGLRRGVNALNNAAFQGFLRLPGESVRDFARRYLERHRTKPFRNCGPGTLEQVAELAGVTLPHLAPQSICPHCGQRVRRSGKFVDV